MSPFGIQLTRGFLPSDLEPEDLPRYEALERLGALERDERGLLRLRSLYRVGRLWISQEGKGFVEGEHKEDKDLLVEPKDLGDAKTATRWW
jgi:ribonuclease R